MSSIMTRPPKTPLWFRWAALIMAGLCTGMAVTLAAAGNLSALPATLIAVFMLALRRSAPARRRATK